MLVFKIFWTIDAITSLIVCYFFFIGLADGSVSSRNMGLWMMILLSTAVIMLGSIWLRNHHYNSMAMGLLLILAIPALLYLIFILVMIISGGKWN